jgi:hypothetical protein
MQKVQLAVKHMEVSRYIPRMFIEDQPGTRIFLKDLIITFKDQTFIRSKG